MKYPAAGSPSPLPAHGFSGRRPHGHPAGFHLPSVADVRIQEPYLG